MTLGLSLVHRSVLASVVLTLCYDIRQQSSGYRFLIMGSKKTGWTLGRLVDFEYFLRERPLSSAQTARWYAERVRGTRLDRDDVSRLLGWVLRCREERPDSPGRWLSRVSQFLWAMALLIVFFSGIGLARRILQFDGFVPINVFVAVAILVALPFLMSLSALLFSFSAFLLRGAPGTRWGKQVRQNLLLRVVAPMIQRIHRGARWTRSMRHWADTLWARSGLYTKAVGWTGFVALQLGGLAFGLGLFAGTLVTGAVDDLSFGWTTTSQILTAERVSAGVQAVAAPWRWLSADWVVPSLEQVADSRYFKKQGVFGLDAGALQAWFPFICAAIFVYGVLPRLLLFLVGWFGLSRAYAKLTFQDADSQDLLRQMRGQHLQVSGSAAETEPERTRVPAPPDDSSSQVHILVHDEALTTSSLAQIEEWVRNRVGAPMRCESVSLDSDEDETFIQQMSEVSQEAALVLVLEGWRPCLEQTKDMIRAVRAQVGKQKLIHLALLGKLTSGALKLSSEQFEAWKESISELRDPYIQLINLSPAHE